jgi:hypothetical protein
MRELPPQAELLLPRDHATIIVIPANGWHCLYCVSPAGDGAASSVTWIQGPDGEFGRCRECGQKYVLEDAR